MVDANLVTLNSINDKLHFLGDSRNNWSLSEELYSIDNKNHIILTGRNSKEIRIEFVNNIVSTLIAIGVIDDSAQRLSASCISQPTLIISVPLYLCVGAKVHHGLYYSYKTNSIGLVINPSRATIFLSLFNSYFEGIINDIILKQLDKLALDLAPITLEASVLAKQIASTPAPTIDTYPDDPTMVTELVNGSYYNGRYQSLLFIKNHELFLIAAKLAELNFLLDSIKLPLTKETLFAATSLLIQITVAIPDTKLLYYSTLIKNNGGQLPADAFAILNNPRAIKLGKSILNKTFKQRP